MPRMREVVDPVEVGPAVWAVSLGPWPNVRRCFSSEPVMTHNRGDDMNHRRLVANRLASGEIDVEEYARLRDALNRTSGSPRT